MKKIFLYVFLTSLLLNCSITEPDVQDIFSEMCMNFSIYTVYPYTNNACNGQLENVLVCIDEKYRLDHILANSHQDCVLVTFEYYSKGKQYNRQGFIKKATN